MISTRRFLLKIGAAGLLIPQGSMVLASEQTNVSFQAWRQKFEASISSRMRAANVVGAAVAITSKQNSSHYVASFGFADVKAQRKLTTKTPMHLASVSKLFTASALVQLFERKQLDLHTDVNEFVDFEVVNPFHPGVAITPHQLLTHTSSISDEGHGDISFEGDPKESLSTFLSNYLVEGGKKYSSSTSYSKAKPGAKWDYSNVGASLGGYIVECVSKQPFSHYVKQNIFDPLGIENAHWYLREFAPHVLAKPYQFENGGFHELPQQGYPDVPAGMLRCSVTDLARALNAMLGQVNGKAEILSHHAVANMLHRQVDTAIYPYQGLGWTDEEAGNGKVVGHTGSDNGASNMVALTPDQDQAVVLLMNNDGTEETAPFRATIIDELLHGAQYCV